MKIRKLLLFSHSVSDLFTAEDNVRLTLYFIKHGHYPSFLTSSTHLPNETTSITMVQTDSSAIEEQESQSPVYPTCECCQHNADELSSDSNEENELSPYDRLQQCLQPISGMKIEFILNSSMESSRCQSSDSTIWSL